MRSSRGGFGEHLLDEVRSQLDVVVHDDEVADLRDGKQLPEGHVDAAGKTLVFPGMEHLDARVFDRVGFEFFHVAGVVVDHDEAEILVPVVEHLLDELLGDVVAAPVDGDDADHWLRSFYWMGPL